jgi:hypothetical protein
MRPAISRTLTVWLALAAMLAGTSQVAEAARRHHAKLHPARHHKPARTRSGQPANGASCVPGGDPNDPEKTFTALSEYTGNLTQFDAIFRCLANYPTVMPGWDVEAKGWTELAPDAGPLDIVLQKALMAGVWQGKVWYTHPDGGAIYNRMFDDRQTWHHRAAWTPTTLLDNKPAILVDATLSPGPTTSEWSSQASTSGSPRSTASSRSGDPTQPGPSPPGWHTDTSPSTS